MDVDRVAVGGLPRRRVRTLIGTMVWVAVSLAACSSDGDADDTTIAAPTIDAPTAATASPPTTPAASAPTSTATNTTTTSTTVVDTTTTTSTTTSTTTTNPTTTSTTSTTTTTVDPATSGAPANPPAPVIEPVDAFAFPTDTPVQIGTSIQGRPITVIRRGTPGGTRVLAIGAIHGNEDAGTAILDRLAADPVPDDVELWLVRSMNPDGQALRIRHNANGVDLNRNFPHRWGPIAQPGDWQYAGPGPASEPETRAVVALGDSVRPDLVLWYHQDLFRINPASGRDGQVRARYAELVGLPLIDVTGGRYTGTASQWSRTVASDDGVGFTVELGETLEEPFVSAHATAVLVVALEFFTQIR